MADFLLEIGLEEMPAHLVTPAEEQLVDRMQTFLTDQRLPHGAIKAYSTPRRLAILVQDLAERAKDNEEEVKGPAKKAAFDETGAYSRAAQGFARGQGLTTDDIYFKEFKGQEYVYVKKFEAGQPAAEVLKGVKDVVAAMTFPTTMRWGRHDFEYIRPIRWLVALLDDQVVPFSLVGVTTDRTSRGHRFLGHAVNLKQAADYQEQLAASFVQVDAKARKDAIWQQIEHLAQEQHWQVVPDADLLEEVNNLVEYPTAFAGDFDPKYLLLPDEVLITSMREHQRFFHVVDDQGQLLPHFISVRNGNADFIDNVIAGNEKVLVARLEDAAFFYQEDQKHTIDEYNAKLEQVSFHAKLGSLASHTRRTQVLAALIADRLQLDQAERAQLARAATIYKFDLMTGMVGEFDELQGVMGEKYARLFGEDPAVAVAIREHYMPTSADGKLPASMLGKVLALADKLETVLSFFAGGMQPSGSNDPYALRRAASGVVNILVANDWTFSLEQLLNDFIVKIVRQDDRFGLPNEVAAELTGQVADVLDFLTDRVVKALHKKGVRRDVIAAVTENGFTNPAQMTISAEVILAHQTEADFRIGVEALTRIMRLTQKNPESGQVQPNLFENEAEQALYDAVLPLTKETDLNQLLTDLLGLHTVIGAYFDQTMVMVDDEQLKANRLATLALVSQQAARIANFVQLDVKSNS
ncbi:glycine--tRNA ligase subunit beta [Weissella halotolerans]|uniref:Glycine--tRNA ligase beta subunit n=1 Tax=Weissella halotolerans DSM 20190 TaxID=1123500 RepID=A0A0R2G2S2_9LACO|nr:glycine--tRNA ligase subunit beta [Weissella halotolerans]KRN31676.1 glycyl-tRNA synthetase subunit beta [Weissella halotolerans DSM 20190]